MYRLQGSQSQSTKVNTLREILTPTSKSSPDLLLGFDANQPKLFLESSFPTHEVATFFLSKMMSLRHFQIIQQAVMTNSLKMLLPKSALACNIVSKGSRL